MDREVVVKKIKAMKSKAKAARKAGKREQALSFKYGMQRLERTLKASAPKVRKKKGEKVEAGPAPTPSPAAPTA